MDKTHQEQKNDITNMKSRFEKALSDPTSVYGVPESVLADPTLDREGKRAILTRWQHDAQQLAVAEDEAMTGGEPNMLHRVSLALEKVEAAANHASSDRTQESNQEDRE